MKLVWCGVAQRRMLGLAIQLQLLDLSDLQTSGIAYRCSTPLSRPARKRCWASCSMPDLMALKAA